MSILDSDVVDFIGVDRKSDELILTISDHLDWSDEHEHLYALQEKINSYLRFVESGEVFETYPNAKGRKIVIDVLGHHPLTDGARAFVIKANEVAMLLDVTLRTRLFSGSSQSS